MMFMYEVTTEKPKRKRFYRNYIRNYISRRNL